jgi:hypothetical protein
MGPTYYSDGRHERADPPPADRVQAAGYLAAQRRDPPAQATANRAEQVRHFHGVPYIAVKAITDLAGSCSYQLLKRRRARRNPTTFGPGGTVAKSVPGTQQQGRDEDYTPVDDLDFPPARLMSRPNPNETTGELASKVILQNCLTGVGPLWAVPNRAGRPVELWALRTPLVSPLWQHSHQYPCGAWRVMPSVPGGWSGPLPGGVSSTGAVLPGEEVKRLLEPHPIWDGDGYSPLTAGAVELDVLRAIDESRKSAMDHGPQLDFVAIVPGADQEQVTRFVKQFEERQGGSKNARKMGAFAPPPGSDKATIQSLNASAREMDYQAGWEQYAKFVLALFGVPGSVAGLTETTSYSELYAALRQFHQRQSQRFGRFEGWLTRVVAWPWCSFPDEYLCRVTMPALEDPDATPENVFKRQLQYDLLTYNQALAKDNNPPVEGGDVPVSIYLETLKAKLAPKPEPALPDPVDPGPQGSGTAGKGPNAGAVPQPDNPDAEGTGVPVAKACPPDAMNTLSGPAGGFLATGRKQARRAKRLVRKALELAEREGGA